MNFPVSRTDFLVSKNVKNPLSIFLRDIDRKPVRIGADTLVLRVVDRRTSRVLLTKDLSMADPVKARYDVMVMPDDLRPLSIGTYTYLVCRRAPDGSEMLVFTDRDRTEVSTFEVREGPIPPPVDPDQIAPGDLVTRSNPLDPARIERYSGSFPGSASVGNTTAIQSYAVSLNGFSGAITLQGSLDMSPTSDDSQWFDIETHTFEGCSCVAGFTVLAHPLWVRFKVSEQRGMVIPGSTCDCGSAAHPTLVWPEQTPAGLVGIVYRS